MRARTPACARALPSRTLDPASRRILWSEPLACGQLGAERVQLVTERLELRRHRHGVRVSQAAVTKSVGDGAANGRKQERDEAERSAPGKRLTREVQKLE
jgi:hypothetical protein